MAFTRIGQSGAEANIIAELPDEFSGEGSGTMAISASTFRTGLRSFLLGANTRGRGWIFSSILSLRTSMFFLHNTGSSASSLFRILATGLSTTAVHVNGTTGLLTITVNNVSVATINWATIGLSTTLTWHQVGLTYYANASAGYVTVYVNGVAVLTWTGNTGTGITGVYYGGVRGVDYSSWATANMDDIWLDGSPIIETDAIPPTKYFVWSIATTAGNYAQFTPLSSTNVSNVDELPHDSDTTYVFTSTANLIDSYNTPSPTIPLGLVPVANIPVVVIKRSDVAIASTFQLGFRESGVDSFGSSITPGASYTVLMDRFTTKPSGGAWDTTSVNAAEVAVKSTGVYV